MRCRTGEEPPAVSGGPALAGVSPPAAGLLGRRRRRPGPRSRRAPLAPAGAGRPRWR